MLCFIHLGIHKKQKQLFDYQVKNCFSLNITKPEKVAKYTVPKLI